MTITPPIQTDETHDPFADSWVESANDPASDFPIQNLPLGVFRPRRDQGGGPRVGTRVGDVVLDLAAVRDAGLLGDVPPQTLGTLETPTLNALMARPRAERVPLRRALFGLLRRANVASAERVQRWLVPAGNVEMLLPAAIGDYTDFYASVFHATNVGSMFRPDNPLLPNYKHVPIGYHGRVSSIVVSGTPVRRPSGQTRAEGEAAPSFGPTARLDYELEVGAFVAGGNNLGEPIPIGRAEEHLFGLCLVNDWSARDVQQWEYQPLGPFLAKNFATTISPWVVTHEALAPFRVPAFARPAGDPDPLPYLDAPGNRTRGGFDLSLEVLISSDRMRASGHAPLALSRGNLQSMYWTVAQMLAHHASNGCNLRPGDLLASGTVSGPQEGSRGCLLELTWRGSRPIELPTGETRRFLQDGDEIILRGWCERPGAKRIGFGECRGVVLPAAPNAEEQG
ncbi:MAG: fumarylacetoacetase [Acidobacteria bacterium]|nr:MAG: fumarylacetoacetase [Acidobacteriota bacterium]RPJ75932.1 MAG: fumarylacetoacetase [Acidobacteriota bacterium]